VRILGISGSLRRHSHNSRLLRAAADALPPGAELEILDGLDAIPPFNEDHDEGAATPEAVVRLRERIAEAVPC
jgi:chromate reductase, NAD(P)H dehydrogenase (quinone)